MRRRDWPFVLAAGVLAMPVLVGSVYLLLAATGLAGAGARGPNLHSVARALSAGETWRGLLWTVTTAAVATGLATVGACLVALCVRGSRAGRLLAVLPLAVPHVAAALAVLLLLGQSGLFSRVAYALGVTTVPSEFPALVYDRAGVALIVTFIWKEFPYLTLTALAVLLTGSSHLEEVARTLGASPAQAFWRVTWPRLWHGISPAVLAAFAFLVGQYEVPALLAPSDPLSFPLLTYERLVDPNLERRGEASVLGLLALALASLVVFAHERYRSGAEVHDA